MFDDLRKSINSILYERLSSPFYGAIIISWVIWNWRVLYVTFFVSEEHLPQNKLDYILECYSDWHFGILYPLISAAILLTLIPFISNGAFWLNLKFEKWKYDKKNLVEGEKLLSLKKSLDLRREIREQGEVFDKLLESKNADISILKEEVKELTKKANEKVSYRLLDGSEKEPKELNKDETELWELLQLANERNLGVTKILEQLMESATILEFDGGVSFCVLNDLIERDPLSSPSHYSITSKGKDLLKLYYKVSSER